MRIKRAVNAVKKRRKVLRSAKGVLEANYTELQNKQL